jgi:hypothetical protein
VRANPEFRSLHFSNFPVSPPSLHPTRAVSSKASSVGRDAGSVKDRSANVEVHRHRHVRFVVFPRQVPFLRARCSLWNEGGGGPSHGPCRCGMADDPVVQRQRATGSLPSRLHSLLLAVALALRCIAVHQLLLGSSSSRAALHKQGLTLDSLSRSSRSRRRHAHPLGVLHSCNASTCLHYPPFSS